MATTSRAGKIDTFRIQLGRNIAARRQELGWTVQVAADRQGVSRNTWDRWERGEVDVPMPQLLMACTTLKRKLADLMPKFG